MINVNWRWSKDIETEILREIKGCYPVVHVCSGSSLIGDIRIDRWFSNLKPNLRADMCFLPIRSGVAAVVICDPPYSWQRNNKQFKPLIEELVRVTAPSGKVIQIFPQVLYHPCLTPLRLWLRPAGDKSVPSHKILSISQKVQSQLTDIS